MSLSRATLLTPLCLVCRHPPSPQEYIEYSGSWRERERCDSNSAWAGPVIPHVGELMLVSFPSASFSEQPLDLEVNDSWYAVLLFSIVLPPSLFPTLSAAHRTISPPYPHPKVANYRWLGEKYDGVRCCWVPSNLSLYPRPFILHSMEYQNYLKLFHFNILTIRLLYI